MHSEEKIQLIKTDPELTQMWKLWNKNIKAIIITLFHKSKRLRNKYTSQIQTELPKMKITMSELKKKKNVSSHTYKD